MDDYVKSSLSSMRSSIELVNEKTKLDMQSIHEKMSESATVINENLMGPIRKTQKELTTPTDMSGITSSIRSIMKVIDSIDLSPTISRMSELAKAFTSNYDYSAIYNTLENNISSIQSIMKNFNNDSINEHLAKINDININIENPTNISTAEMEAYIKGEEYVKPDLDYKHFDVLLKGISFVNDPVKASENLNKAFFIADHLADNSFKIKIYNMLIDEITTLISGGVIVLAGTITWIMLNYILRDSEIFKKFIDLVHSIKEINK